MMMRIPPEIIKKWVYANFEPKERKQGDELLIPNPFRDDGKYKFSISLSKGICSDWRDDNPWAGPPSKRTGKRDIRFIRFVEIYLNCSREHALTSIFGNSVRSFLTTSYEQYKPVEEEKYAEYEAPSNTHSLSDGTIISNAVLNYVYSRGYTPETAGAERLRRSGCDVLWTYSEFGEDVYYQTRNIISKSFWFPPIDDVDDNSTVISTHEFGKDDFLYGFDLVDRASFVVLTESIFDRMTLWDQALSVGSCYLSKSQIKKLKILGPKNGVILAFDNDKSGVDAMLKHSLDIESAGLKCYFSVPPEVYVDKNTTTKDWNELFTKARLTKDEIKAEFNKGIVRASPQSRIAMSSKLVLAK